MGIIGIILGEISVPNFVNKLDFSDLISNGMPHVS